MLSSLPTFKELVKEYEAMRYTKIKNFFAADKKRLDTMSIAYKDMFLDFSKNRATKHTMDLLFRLAEECGIKEAIQAMFSGEKINTTEGRAVLHTALRNRANRPILVDGKDVMPHVNRVLEKMRNFSDDVRNGRFTGSTNLPFTDIVNIGIGGSDLGPKMVVHALKKYQKPGLNIHFVSNVDSTDITEALTGLNPETTLFIVTSKTFTTLETLTNAKTARAWIISNLGAAAVEKHFVAISTNKDAVEAFGIDSENMFEFWDWVGGRYSLWSAVGLVIAIAVGFDKFSQLLDGAFAMDEHFRLAPLPENIPLVLGVLEVWYSTFFDCRTYAILPYDEYLSDLPAFLQQLEMESNGKAVTKTNEKIHHYQTSPIVWGAAGTNGQHSFYQLLHQGTQIVPCDFIVPAISLNELGEHQDMLIANALAQTEALLRGKTREEVIAEGVEEDMINHKIFYGNKPSNTIIINKLTPFSLGLLIAMYEHKTFTEGVIWNVNSFDQWGVELGKKLAQVIFPEIKGEKTTEELQEEHDPSTAALIERVRSIRSGVRKAMAEEKK